MDPAMYIILNKGLGMSPGKLASQAAHAAVEAYLLSPDDNLRRVWRRGGHYKKIILEARDAAHFFSCGRYVEDRGFAVAMIIDEGRTEIPPITPTAIGVQIVDKDHAHARATFGSFDLYSDADLWRRYQR